MHTIRVVIQQQQCACMRVKIVPGGVNSMHFLPRLRVVSSVQQLSVSLNMYVLAAFLTCITLFRTPVVFLFFFFSPLCRYLLPRIRVVSPVQQLSVPLQHVCCSSWSLSDLASHPSELLSAFCLFVLFRSFFSYFSGLACFVVFSYQVR